MFANQTPQNPEPLAPFSSNRFPPSSASSLENTVWLGDFPASLTQSRSLSSFIQQVECGLLSRVLPCKAWGDKDDLPGTQKRSSLDQKKKKNSQWQCSKARAVRALEVPISPRCPGSAKAGAPPGRPAATRSERPGDKHSGQSELQSQRARHKPMTCQNSGSLSVAGDLGTSPGSGGGAGQGMRPRC